MILTTTPSIEGRKVASYLGIITGEAIMGTNIMRDLFASITDVIGGRSGAYEEKLQEARHIALHELEERAARLGANAVVGIDLDYEVVGQSGSMLMFFLINQYLDVSVLFLLILKKPQLIWQPCQL